MKTHTLVLRGWAPGRPSDQIPAAGTLVETDRMIRLGKKQVGVKHVLSDVPAKRFEIVMADEPPHLRPGEELATLIEVVHVRGHADGAMRTQLVLRAMGMVDIRGIGALPVFLDWTAPDDGATWRVVVEMDVPGETHGPILWVQHFQRLRSTLEPGGLERIVWWHASRYFTHMASEAVTEVCTYLVATWTARMDAGEAIDLASANREVERELYGASRREGWRKLTMRERLRLGLGADSPCWQRISVREARYSATGCGEETLRAARGPEGVRLVRSDVDPSGPYAD